jgi:hypothetical protein
MGESEEYRRPFPDRGEHGIGVDREVGRDPRNREEVSDQDSLAATDAELNASPFSDDLSDDDLCALCICDPPAHEPTFGPCQSCDCLEYVPGWSLEDDSCSTLLDEMTAEEIEAALPEEEEEDEFDDVSAHLESLVGDDVEEDEQHLQELDEAFLESPFPKDEAPVESERVLSEPILFVGRSSKQCAICRKIKLNNSFKAGTTECWTCQQDIVLISSEEEEYIEEPEDDYEAELRETWKDDYRNTLRALTE